LDCAAARGIENIVYVLPTYSREVLFDFALPHLLFAICPPLLRISGVKLEELPAFLWEDDKQKTEKEVKAEEPKNA
jgi:hypothetical protein